MINYYELLEISKDASRDTIEAAIRKMRRTWNNRANNPNADIRAEAEQRIRAIAEAERILLDDSARREYDARLASAPVTGSTSGPSGREADDSEDWISLAIEYDERKDYDSLARLMEKVTRMYPNNARAWVWRGLASEATDSVNDAVYEFKKAISLEPNNAVYHAVLGDLYMDHDENRAAEDEYRTAYRLSPNDNEYKLNVAMICGVQEKYDEALKLSSEVFHEDRNNERAQHIYALSLYNTTLQSISYNKTTGDYVVTNEAQLAFLKGKIALFDELPTGNPKVKEIVDEVHKIARNAETKQFRPSDRMAVYVVAAIIGLIILFSGSTNTIIGLAIVAAVVAVYIFRHNIPGWKWQQRTAGSDTKNSGLQG